MKKIFCIATISILLLTIAFLLKDTGIQSSTGMITSDLSLNDQTDTVLLCNDGSVCKSPIFIELEILDDVVKKGSELTFKLDLIGAEIDGQTTALFVITDYRGKVVLTESMIVKEESFTTTIPLTDIPMGIYDLFVEVHHLDDATETKLEFTIIQ